MMSKKRGSCQNFLSQNLRILFFLNQAGLSFLHKEQRIFLPSCAHFLLHGGDEGVTAALEKTAFFTMRALVWLDSGRFPGSRAELPEKYREVLVSGPEGLFGWASDVIKNVF